MPLDMHPIAIKCAVLCFFGVSIAGALCGVSAQTCSQRGFLGALGAYIIVRILGWAVNAILTQAILDDYIFKNEKRAENESK